LFVFYSNLASSFFCPLNAVTVLIAPRTSCATALAFENAFTSLSVYFLIIYINRKQIQIILFIYQRTRIVILNANTVNGLSAINTNDNFHPLKKQLYLTNRFFF